MSSLYKEQSAKISRKKPRLQPVIPGNLFEKRHRKVKSLPKTA